MAEIAKIHGQDIRDKRIADATDASSASDITSQCKFLLENGQTGEFMQVLKSYIDESVRSALGPLLNNLDKGTGLKAVAGIDSDNDLGTATLSNLASMLSAASEVLPSRIENITNTHFNSWDDIPSGVFWVGTNTLQNKPNNGYNYCICYGNTQIGKKLQIAIYDEMTKFSIRAIVDGAWKSWKEYTYG